MFARNTHVNGRGGNEPGLENPQNGRKKKSNKQRGGEMGDSTKSCHTVNRCEKLGMLWAHCLGTSRADAS